MRKILFALTLLLTAIVAQAQLLWKISGNGLQKPSFIIGTYHLAPVSFVDSIPGLKDAMGASEQVYGEIVMADMMKPENLTKMQSEMVLPEGQTLDKMFTADEMARINALVKDILGVDMANPMVAQQLGRLTPQSLATQLTVLMYLKKHPGFDQTKSFDGYFQTEASAKGKSTGGLETVDFQIDVLYKGKPMERQKQLLLCLADNKDTYEKQSEDIIEAFFSQDLKAIGEAIDRKMNNSCDDTPEERDKLIYNRNAEWIKKMPEIMKQKSTLFAVGAGHLTGDRGMLELLKKAGYTVESVK